MFTDAGFVLPNAVAKEVYEDFQCLYKQYLGRTLTAAEKFVFDSVIKIMIWKVHGKTFSKICQERYAYVSNVAQRRLLSRTGQQDRAERLAKYIKYGTEDSTEIWIYDMGFLLKKLNG